MPIPKRKYHDRGKRVHGFLTIEHPLYHVWYNMLKRCFNEDDPAFQNYGGRGIKVCDEWLHFENFALDMGLKPEPHLTLERKDNEKGYFKSNCKWETPSNQCLNRRVFKGKLYPTGVEKTKFGNFLASFGYEYVSYNLGRFPTVEKAVEIRDKFEQLFFSNRKEAMKMVTSKEKAFWSNSKSGIRGVTPHYDGVGYIARCTIKGERFYVGYFMSVEEAAKAISDFKCQMKTNRNEALKMLQQEKVRRNSSTGHSGISISENGFVVRETKGGKRAHVGTYKTLEEAIDAKRKFVKGRN